MTPECARCGDPVPDLAYVCRRDGERLRAALLALADDAGEVTVDVARQARHAAAAAAGSPEPPLPVHMGAGAAAWAVGNTVITWAVHVSHHRGVPTPPRPGRTLGPLCRAGYGCRHASCTAIRTRAVEHPVGRAARWLTRHIDWLRHRPEAADAVDELLDAAELVRRTIDNPGDRWYAGPCGAAGDDGTQCLTELYARHGSTYVTCKGCGTRFDAEARKQWLLGEASATVGTAAVLAAAATALGVQATAAQIRGYAFRGRLADRGMDAWGRPVYLLGEALALVRQAEQERQVARARRAAAVAATPSAATVLDTGATSANA